ncbi:hypothetical protein [Amycolatopsis alkalitolerans]|uniref:Uncharacterized protein n=1 Tax=Amycolatopsis alkalitolerans TaxID=2547244 RepID=A0A5C4LRA4_9PSEU|nr:hypothetical protein [Amycolatopsis alkalitolerans]TNC20830.1 hypothetical protein FG385_30220 [Amycolatopsis alkalitolerans]
MRYADWRRRRPLRPGTEDLFVPPTPVAAFACRYDGPRVTPGMGLGGQGGTMLRTRHGRVDDADLVRLVDDLNRAKRGVMRCPFNPWSVVVLHFDYGEGPPAEIVMGVVGCFNATNGTRDAIVPRLKLPEVVVPYT